MLSPRTTLKNWLRFISFGQDTMKSKLTSDFGTQRGFFLIIAGGVKEVACGVIRMGVQNEHNMIKFVPIDECMISPSAKVKSGGENTYILLSALTLSDTWVMCSCMASSLLRSNQIISWWRSFLSPR